MGRLRGLFKKFFSSAKPHSFRRSAPDSVLGEHYHLQEIYHALNQRYFSGTLDLAITWCGCKQRRARRSRRLGVYCFRTKKVKIHRLLDQAHFPSYFISFVVYHEMLHSVLPPVKDNRGRRRIHHGEFKRREKEFEEYALVKRWEQENRKLFF